MAYRLPDPGGLFTGPRMLVLAALAVVVTAGFSVLSGSQQQSTDCTPTRARCVSLLEVFPPGFGVAGDTYVMWDRALYRTSTLPPRHLLVRGTRPPMTWEGPDLLVIDLGAHPWTLEGDGPEGFVVRLRYIDPQRGAVVEEISAGRPRP